MAAMLPLWTSSAVAANTPQGAATTAEQGKLQSANGLRTAEFTLPQGKISVYLPEDIRAGDTITGTVVAEPSGANDAQKTANRGILEGYVVELNGPPSKSSGSQRTWPLHALSQYCGATLTLRAQDRAAISAPPIRVEPPSLVPPGVPRLPGNAVLGRPISVSGPFDGDSANTSLKVGGQLASPLAESPRQAIFGPVSALGTQPIALSEKGQTTTGECTFVTFNLTIGDAVIRTGQSTQATVRVGGLLGRKDPLTCFLFNHDPSIVRLEGGDVVPLTIQPRELGEDGSYRKNIRVTATGVGIYRLSLQFPGESGPPTELTPSVAPSEDDPEDRPEPFGVAFDPMPARINGTRPVTFSFRDLNAKNPTVAATMAIRREPNGSWQSLPVNGHSAIWERATDAGGLYTVRVEAVDDHQRVAFDQKTIEAENPEGGRAGRMEFNNRSFQMEFNKRAGDLILMSAAGDPYRRRADGLRGRADDLRGEARKKEQEANDEWNAAEAKRREAAALAANDRRIEGAIEDITGPIAEILKRIAELKGALAGKGGPAQIAKAAADAQNAADDCKKDCDKKKAEREQLEKDIADLESQLEQLAKDVADLFHGDGWSGRATFDKAAGIVRWGFIREGGGEIGNNMNPKTQKANDLRKQKNKLQKDLKKKKEDLERAKEDEKNCQKHCEEMQKKADEAKKAQEQSNEQAAQQAKMDGLQEQLKNEMQKLADYLASHPDIDPSLKKELDDLIKQMPVDPDKWEDFLQKVKAALDKKKAAESKAEQDAKDHDAKGAAAADEAKRKRDEAAANDAAAAEAERQARDAEDAAKRQEAAAAEAARKAKAAEEQRHRDCMEKFKKWIQDNIDKGILDDSALDKLKKWLDDNASKIGDLGGVVGNGAGSALGGLAKGKSGGAAGASALAEGLFNLGAAIFYWWAEAELKDACRRLGKKVDEVTKQRIAAELIGDKQPCGIIHPMRDQSQSWFYFRKGNKLLLFKISRDGGLEFKGEIDG